MTSLNLSRNLLCCADPVGGSFSFDPAGMRALASALLGLCSLTHLDLRESYIRDEGCHCILSALKVTASVTSLDLSSNALGAASLADAADLVRRTGVVALLDMSDNMLGPTSRSRGDSGGVIAMAMALEDTRSMLRLGLLRTRILGKQRERLRRSFDGMVGKPEDSVTGRGAGAARQLLV
jgi:hypothetical protein